LIFSFRGQFYEQMQSGHGLNHCHGSLTTSVEDSEKAALNGAAYKPVANPSTLTSSSLSPMDQKAQQFLGLPEWHSQQHPNHREWGSWSPPLPGCWCQKTQCILAWHIFPEGYTLKPVITLWILQQPWKKQQIVEVRTNGTGHHSKKFKCNNEPRYHDE
jgi:hypothetical protein